MIVVGAGIVGVACGVANVPWAASRFLGVFTAVRWPGGTTAAAMGHLVVMDDSEAQFT